MTLNFLPLLNSVWFLSDSFLKDCLWFASLDLNVVACANRTWPHSINATNSFLHVDTPENFYYARTLVLLDINSQPIY